MLTDEIGRQAGERRRSPPLGDKGRELVGAVGDPISVEAQDTRGFVERPEDRAGVDLWPERIETELELRRDPEIAASSTETPEEVGVLLLTGLYELALGGDEVDGEQVVDGEAELSHRKADPAAKRQPCQARMRDEPGGNGKSKGLRLAVQLPQEHAGLSANRSCFGIDA